MSSKENTNLIVKMFYPVNSAGYDDPDANIDEIFKEIDETIAAVKQQCEDKKLRAVEKSEMGLQRWLEKGVNKQGEPITDKQREWGSKKLEEYKKYRLAVVSKLVEVPKSVTDEWQKEFYELT